jgi:pyroglutamyl-peptidase
MIHAMALLKLMLTGFEPFAQYAINPSWEAARQVAAARGDRVQAHRLPVDHFRARETLLQLLELHRPDACLCMGLAAGDCFRLERQARRPAQFHAAAGDGALRRGRFAFDGIARTLRRVGATWRYSDDCGQYVCESAYWTLLEHAAGNGWPRQCGFLHVPAESKLWPTQRTVQVVMAVVEDLLSFHTDDGSHTD